MSLAHDRPPSASPRHPQRFDWLSPVPELGTHSFDAKLKSRSFPLGGAEAQSLRVLGNCLFGLVLRAIGERRLDLDADFDFGVWVGSKYRNNFFGGRQARIKTGGRGHRNGVIQVFFACGFSSSQLKKAKNILYYCFSAAHAKPSGLLTGAICPLTCKLFKSIIAILSRW
jgi:hypothetical protein